MYTTKSDVWSYGMVMYEIWSLGDKPFPHLTAQEASVSVRTQSYTLVQDYSSSLVLQWGLLSWFRHEKGVVVWIAAIDC